MEIKIQNHSFIKANFRKVPVESNDNRNPTKSEEKTENSDRDFSAMKSGGKSAA